MTTKPLPIGTRVKAIAGPPHLIDRIGTVTSHKTEYVYDYPNWVTFDNDEGAERGFHGYELQPYEPLTADALIAAVEADRDALEALAGSVLTDHIITFLKERA